MTIKVTWVSHNRKAKNQPDPRYPNGIALDISYGRVPSCFVEFTYPAPECGIYLVECDVCNQVTAITAAGRLDDPVSVRFACKWMPPAGSKLQ